MRAVEHVHGAERAGELREQLGTGTAEGTGGDVGIAERLHRDAPLPERAHHADPAARELLGVVDEHHPQGCERPEGGAVGGAEDPRRLAEEVGGVTVRGPQGVEHRAVLLHEVGGRCPHRVARGAQLRRARPQLRAFREEGAQLGAEALRGADRLAERRRPGDAGVLGISGQQFGDDAILVGAGEQRRRLGAFADHRPADQLERERPERACQWPWRRQADAHADPVAQRGGRLPARGERQHLLRTQPLDLEELHDPVDERARLTRAGGADHDAGRGRRRRDHS